MYAYIFLYPSLEIIFPCLLRDQIEHRFRAEIPRHWTSNRFVGVYGILLIDLDRLTSSSSGGSIRQQLCLTALLHTDKPENRLLHRLAYCQQTMVLQKRCLLVAKTFSNIVAFFGGEYDAVERFVQLILQLAADSSWWFVVCLHKTHHMVVMEGT